MHRAGSILIQVPNQIQTESRIVSEANIASGKVKPHDKVLAELRARRVTRLSSGD